MRLLSNYPNQSVARALEEFPKNTTTSMLVYIVTLELFSLDKELNNVALPIYANFMFLVLRKIDVRMNEQTVMRLANKWFQYKRTCEDRVARDKIKLALSDVYAKMFQIIKDDIDDLAEPFPFTELKSESWNASVGPLLWILIHIAFAHHQLPEDDSKKIKQHQSILLLTLEAFIGCAICRTHYRENRESIMHGLKDYLHNGEQFAIKMHQYITCMIHKHAIILTYDPTQTIMKYAIVYRKLIDQIQQTTKIIEIE